MSKLIFIVFGWVLKGVLWLGNLCVRSLFDSVNDLHWIKILGKGQNAYYYLTLYDINDLFC